MSLAAQGRLSTLCRCLMLSIFMMSIWPYVALQANQDNEVPSSPPASNVWDLIPFAINEENWQQKRQSLERQIDTLASFQSIFLNSSHDLRLALEAITAAQEKAAHLHAYASLVADTHQQNPSMLRQKEQAQATLSRLGRVLSFVQPAIAQAGEGKIQQFLESEPALEPYRHYLLDILRTAPHGLSPAAAQKIVATYPEAKTPAAVYPRLLLNHTWPTVTLSSGVTVKLNPDGYRAQRTNRNRADRALALQTFWQSWQAEGTRYASAFNGLAQAHNAAAQARGFDTALEAALFEDNIPPAVYDTLLDSADEMLPLFHRYLALRRKILKLETLGYHDIHIPLSSLAASIPFEQAKNITKAALGPMGTVYQTQLSNGFNGAWMDALPRTGKRAGAYTQTATLDIHPYIFLNYKGTAADVATLAHEWGHALHSLQARAHNPAPTAGLPAFSAEMIATVNDILAQDYFIGHAANTRERLHHIIVALESLHAAFFRQAMLAAFEQTAHTHAQTGKRLTQEKLNETYLALLHRFYGSNGMVDIPEYFSTEWAFYPELHLNFQLYNRATAIAGAVAFASRMQEDGPDAVYAFLGLLQAGSNDYPMQQLMNAGLDLREPEAYAPLANRMQALLDHADQLLLDEERPAHSSPVQEKVSQDRLIAGARVFRVCSDCHSLDQNSEHKVGPSLYDIVGRPSASIPDFPYSEALLSDKGERWTPERLNRYIARPKLHLPDNKMAFAGITSPHARADLIAWLETQPKPSEYRAYYDTSVSTQIDIERGIVLSRPCLACHEATPNAGHKIGPNLWGLIGRPIASAEAFDYSEDLLARSGFWTPVTLDAFFSEQKQFKQGSHLAFRQLVSADDRQAIIAWLKSLTDAPQNP